MNSEQSIQRTNDSGKEKNIRCATDTLDLAKIESQKNETKESKEQKYSRIFNNIFLNNEDFQIYYDALKELHTSIQKNNQDREIKAREIKDLIIKEREFNDYKETLISYKSTLTSKISFLEDLKAVLHRVKIGIDDYKKQNNVNFLENSLARLEQNNTKIGGDSQKESAESSSNLSHSDHSQTISLLREMVQTIAGLRETAQQLDEADRLLKNSSNTENNLQEVQKHQQKKLGDFNRLKDLVLAQQEELASQIQANSKEIEIIQVNLRQTEKHLQTIKANLQTCEQDRNELNKYSTKLEQVKEEKKNKLKPIYEKLSKEQKNAVKWHESNQMNIRNLEKKQQTVEQKKTNYQKLEKDLGEFVRNLEKLEDTITNDLQNKIQFGTENLQTLVEELKKISSGFSDDQGINEQLKPESAEGSSHSNQGDVSSQKLGKEKTGTQIVSHREVSSPSHEQPVQTALSEIIETRGDVFQKIEELKHTVKNQGETHDLFKHYDLGYRPQSNDANQIIAHVREKLPYFFPQPDSSHHEAPEMLENAALQLLDQQCREIQTNPLVESTAEAPSPSRAQHSPADKLSRILEQILQDTPPTAISNQEDYTKIKRDLKKLTGIIENSYKAIRSSDLLLDFYNRYAENQKSPGKPIINLKETIYSHYYHSIYQIKNIRNFRQDVQAIADYNRKLNEDIPTIISNIVASSKKMLELAQKEVQDAKQTLQSTEAELQKCRNIAGNPDEERKKPATEHKEEASLGNLYVKGAVDALNKQNSK